MDVMLEAGTLVRFLDLRPKVIVASCDPLADARPDDSGDPPFDVWVYEPAANGCVLRPRTPEGAGRGALVGAPNPTAAPTVLAAQTGDGQAALEPLRVWWACGGPKPAVPVVRCRDADDAAVQIARALLRAAQEQLGAAAEQAAAAAAQLFELRCEYEQMRVAVDALQHEVGCMRWRPRLAPAHWPPDGRTFAPPGGEGELAQPLPVAAEGFAGVDLHFPAPPDRAGDAQVFVRLHARDAGRDLGAWRLTPDQFGKGWVRCWLPEVLADASHDLELLLRWHSGAPAVSLASVGDWDELRCRAPGAPDDSCLALTAWVAGTPGVPLPGGPKWCPSHAGGVIEYGLSDNDVGRMRPRLPAIEGLPAHWAPFQRRADGGFALHPYGPRATTVQLRDGCVPGVERVTAVVKAPVTPYGRGDVQYALAATNREDAASLLDALDPAADPCCVAFSGWHSVPRDDVPLAIALNFAEPPGRPAHLLLATRMPPGDPLAWAYADWLEVRCRVRGVRALPLETAGETKNSRAA